MEMGVGFLVLDPWVWIEARSKKAKLFKNPGVISPATPIEKKLFSNSKALNPPRPPND